MTPTMSFYNLRDALPGRLGAIQRQLADADLVSPLGMMSQPHMCGALRMNSPSSRCSHLMAAAS